MKTRFTLTSLALASLMMMGNAAMAAVVPSGTSQFFNVKLTETFAKKPFPQQPKPKHRFSAVSAPNTS